MPTLKTIAVPPESPEIRLEQGHDEISVLDLIVILTAHRWMILKVAAGCTVVALAIAFLLPVRFTANITVLPPQHNSSMTSALTSQLANLGNLASLAEGSFGLKTPNEMYVTMLRSETVEDAMINRYGLMKEYGCKYLSQARKVFEKRFDVKANEKDDLIHISVEDRDPRRAAEMANGYVEQFRSLSQGLAITEASQRRLFFEQQLEQTKDKLADAEEALKETEQKTGMLQVDSQARALIESAAMLRAQIEAKEVQIQMMRTYAGDQNATLVEAEQGLSELRAQLAKLVGNKDDETEGLIEPKGVVPEAGLEYVRKYRDVKYYETMFEILARQYELAKLDEAKEGALIQVVDPAHVPDRKSFPPRALIAAAGLFLGLLLGVSFALLQTLLARMRNDPESNAKLNFVRHSFAIKRRPEAVKP
jgi:tyrosine-protein kinase Etk/Wzc